MTRYSCVVVDPGYQYPLSVAIEFRGFGDLCTALCRDYQAQLRHDSEASVSLSYLQGCVCDEVVSICQLFLNQSDQTRFVLRQSACCMTGISILGARMR